MTKRAPAQVLRPPARALSGWRAHFAEAMRLTGHTRESVASVLGCKRQHVDRLLDRTKRRHLHTEDWELLRDHPATRELWAEFLRLHQGGAPLLAAGSDER